MAKAREQIFDMERGKEQKTAVHAEELGRLGQRLAPLEKLEEGGVAQRGHCFGDKPVEKANDERE